MPGSDDVWEGSEDFAPPVPDAGQPPRKKQRKGQAKELMDSPRKSCYIEYCQEVCDGKQNCCKNHKKRRGNMLTQARRLGEKHVEAIKAQMANAETATEEMKENEANFPTSKFGKQQAVDWTRLMREWGKRISSIDRTKCKPYEKQQFLIEGQAKMGWSEADAVEQWNLMEASSEIERDDAGLRGCLRLYLPREMRLMDVEKYCQASVQTGTKDIKTPSKEIRDGLRNHIQVAAREDDRFVRRVPLEGIDGEVMDRDDSSVLTFDALPGSQK